MNLINLILAILHIYEAVICSFMYQLCNMYSLVSFEGRCPRLPSTVWKSLMAFLTSSKLEKFVFVIVNNPKECPHIRFSRSTTRNTTLHFKGPSLELLCDIWKTFQRLAGYIFSMVWIQCIVLEMVVVTCYDS